MPKIISYNVPWLARPAPGFGLFNNEQSGQATGKRSNAKTGSDDAPYEGPRRLIAHRGTEVFTVVGKQIRWADLTTLKNSWDIRGRDLNGPSASQSLRLPAGDSAEYRILNFSIHQTIRQIIPSPSGNFIAILTSHTVHIAILPDASHLDDQDRSPLKLRTWQIGRTTHCLGEGRSPLISALWHPLALATSQQDCLITLTSDAIVRMWEFDRNNTYTMDNAALAIDLKKLADGQSCDDDYAPSGFGKVQAFSPDSFDMEVASACFGGQGYDDEDGWAAMALWVAMRNGDVYSLCPFLPSRWTPSMTVIPSLSTSVVSKLALLQDNDLDVEQAKAIRQQYQWVQEIDDEEPAIGTPNSDSSTPIVIHKRPSNPSAIPRLQGPFIPNLLDDELEALDITDVHVIASRTRATEIDNFDEEDEDESASATIINLSTSEGRVLVCLSVDSIEGQWLPKSKKAAFSVPNTEAAELLVLDDIAAPSPISGTADPKSQWPVFTQDIASAYNFFLTTASTVVFYSLADWIPRFESEMISAQSSPEADSGLAFRLKILCESDIVLHEEVLRIDSLDVQSESVHLSACQIFESYDTGYFLLAATQSQPYSVLFDDSSAESTAGSVLLALPPAPANETPIPDAPVRAAYAPSSAFYDSFAATLSNTITTQIPSRHRAMIKSEIRMSPATLDVMATAHRTVSTQTAALERSAAELFRRVERLRSEIHDAVEQMVGLAERVQGLQQDVQDNEKGTIDERVASVSTRQKELMERYEALKKKVARGSLSGGHETELNAKEVAWAEEIQRMGKNVGLDDTGGETNEGTNDAAELKARYDKTKSVTTSLLSQVSSLTSQPSQPSQPPRQPLPSSTSSIPGASTSTSTLTSTPTTANPLLPQNLPNTPQTEKSLQQSLRQSQPQRPSSPAPSLISSLNAHNDNKLANMNIPTKFQKKKIDEAMGLVERESAVIEGARRRLERLSMGISL